jgi:predicted amidophosphoribosyltransferase
VLRPPAGPVVALFAYEGVGRQLVVSLKYRNQRAHVAWLGRALAGSLPSGVDLVTWVPTTAARRRRRGVDQARCLAVSAARAAGVPAIGTLRRSGPAQTGQSRAQRLAGPDFATTRAAVAVRDRRVALVDDVVTTGASLAGAAARLREAGAVSVSAHVVAFRGAP